MGDVLGAQCTGARWWRPELARGRFHEEHRLESGLSGEGSREGIPRDPIQRDLDAIDAKIQSASWSWVCGMRTRPDGLACSRYEEIDWPKERRIFGEQKGKLFGWWQMSRRNAKEEGSI
jgi:hypothetical protein